MITFKLKQTRTFWNFLSRYLRDYGGWDAIFGSPFFLVACALSAVSYHSWINASWTSLSLSILPNLLGFSIGTYALLFSMISSRMKKALKALKNNRDITYLSEMNATFFHFIFVQVITITWAFMYDQTLFYDIKLFIAERFPQNFDLFPILAAIGGWAGVALLLYSVFLAVASSLLVSRLARIVDPAD